MKNKLDPTAERLAELEARVAWLEQLPDAIATREHERVVSYNATAEQALAADRASRQQATLERATALTAHLAVLELTPDRRPFVTKRQVPLHVNGQFMMFEAPGNSVAVMPREQIDTWRRTSEEFEAMIADGTFVIRDLTPAERLRHL